MVTVAAFRRMAKSFSGAEEHPHFEKTSFRIKKRIFATLDNKKKTAVVKLTLIDQSAFCSFDSAVMYPVPGLWGKHGWTMIDLTKVRISMLNDALATAFATVAIKKK